MTFHTTTCVRSPGKGTKPAREQAREDQTDQGRVIVEKELMNGRVTEEMTEERKEARRAPKGSKPDWYVTRTKEALETKAKAKARARAKPDIATIAKSKGISV